MDRTSQDSTHAVDTRKVAGRRILRFESIDQMMAEVDRLAEAERTGRLRRLGNWTLGQMLGHLAAWVEYGYTGLPVRVPLFVRWVVWLRRREFLRGPTRAGSRIPGVSGGTLATDSVPLDEAMCRFRRIMGRLKSEGPTASDRFFGTLRHEESIALALRHAELHLSFLILESTPGTLGAPILIGVD